MSTEHTWGLYKKINQLLGEGYDRKTLADILDALSPGTVGAAQPLSGILERADRIVSGVAAIVRIWNDDMKQLEPLLCINLNDKTGCVDMDPLTPLTSHVFDTERPRLTQRAWYHRRLQQECRPGTYLSLPLNFRHALLGTVSFFTHDERAFTQAEALKLFGLADEMAAAVGGLRPGPYRSTG